MKHKLAVTAVIFTVLGILMTSALLLYGHSQANTAPLPASLDVSGNNLQIFGPIQITSGSWAVDFDFTPLNHNGSVLVLTGDKQMVNYQNDPSGNAGHIHIDEDYSGPVYIQTYGASWHLTAH